MKKLKSDFAHIFRKCFDYKIHLTRKRILFTSQFNKYKIFAEKKHNMHTPPSCVFLQRLLIGNLPVLLSVLSHEADCADFQISDYLSVLSLDGFLVRVM